MLVFCCCKNNNNNSKTTTMTKATSTGRDCLGLWQWGQGAIINSYIFFIISTRHREETGSGLTMRLEVSTLISGNIFLLVRLQLLNLPQTLPPTGDQVSYLSLWGIFSSKPQHAIGTKAVTTICTSPKLHFYPLGIFKCPY